MLATPLRTLTIALLCSMAGGCGTEEEQIVDDPTAMLRFANMMPDSADSVLFCLYDGTEELGSFPSDAVGFRGVSSHLAVPAGVALTVEVFDANDVSSTCPSTDPIASSAGTIELAQGQDYTVVAKGIAPLSNGDAPSICFDPAGQTFDQPCAADRLPSISLMQDDPVPVAGQTKVRITTNTPNIPGIDICYDADGVDGTASPTEPLFLNLGFGTVSDYVIRDEITTGFLVTTAHIPGQECPLLDLDGDSVIDTLAAPETPFPLPAPIGTSAFPGTTNVFAAGDVITIFGAGIAPPSNAATDPIPLPYPDN